ncbi:Eco57I restriction-modification methylase domain-containing protein [Nocardia carnea]|uniref:Eco57I restriction-modification methylase domain-containing protein n=1 Tax=Nocardia carnea TaxID=37328 RepID=UPI002456AC8C|nr:Eco57I restriction-modification methylase domain-containing protein [Nocardia carnea]
MTTGFSTTATGIVAQSETRRKETSSSLVAGQRAKLGQFFTPAPVADFMASLARIDPAQFIRILDPGAGTGSLTASLVQRILAEQPTAQISITACEVDPKLHPALRATLSDCVTAAGESGGYVEAELVASDFISWMWERERSVTEQDFFDLVIANPPYKKLSAGSFERKAVDNLCTETSNLYSAFLALGVHALRPGGQLVAITPRSFTNGLYFRPFRKYFLNRMSLDHIHIFEARNKVFADTEVLQENVIFSATRTDLTERHPVLVSTSISHSTEVHSRTVDYESIVHPNDAELFIHISADESDAQMISIHADFPSTLADIAQVSTGRVVDFRSKDHLRPDPVDGAVPLIYPLHMADGAIRWPVDGAKKNNAIMLNEETLKQTFPSGHYVVVKRLSSKEERRRVVAALFDADDIACERIGFENHVNVFHANGRGLDKVLARGLCLWLNSTLLDRLLRRFSGHTQVNATDLRSLRYPSRDQLIAIGENWPEAGWLDQERIDRLVERHLNLDSQTYRAR